MRKNVIFLFLFVVLISGCRIMSVDSQDLTENYYPAKRSPDDVLYFESVDRPRKVIATVRVNAERNQEINDILQKMKREAAILGGDAITDLRTNAGGLWKKLPGQKFVGNAYVRANYTASVVIFE